jgi:hypothetical protein
LTGKLELHTICLLLDQRTTNSREKVAALWLLSTGEEGSPDELRNPAGNHLMWWLFAGCRSRVTERGAMEVGDGVMGVAVGRRPWWWVVRRTKEKKRGGVMVVLVIVAGEKLNGEGGRQRWGTSMRKVMFILGCRRGTMGGGGDG